MSGRSTGRACIGRGSVGTGSGVTAIVVEYPVRRSAPKALMGTVKRPMPTAAAAKAWRLITRRALRLSASPQRLGIVCIFTSNLFVVEAKRMGGPRYRTIAVLRKYVTTVVRPLTVQRRKLDQPTTGWPKRSSVLLQHPICPPLKSFRSAARPCIALNNWASPASAWVHTLARCLKLVPGMAPLATICLNLAIDTAIRARER